MVILNEGRANEVALRVVLESDASGREYFDDYDTTKEIVKALGRLVNSASKEAAHDGIERIVALAIVPKANYGDPVGYGFGLGLDND